MDRAFVLGGTFSLTFGTAAKEEPTRPAEIKSLAEIGIEPFSCPAAIRAETAFFDTFSSEDLEIEKDPHVLMFLSDAIFMQDEIHVGMNENSLSWSRETNDGANASRPALTR